MRFDAGAVPLFDGVLAIAGQNRSGGMGSNLEHFGEGVRRVDAGVDADLEMRCCTTRKPQGVCWLRSSAEAADAGRGGAFALRGDRGAESARSERACRVCTFVVAAVSSACGDSSLNGINLGCL